ADPLAYTVWGLAALAIAAGLLAFDERLTCATGLLCGVSGVLAVAGGVGFVIQNDLLELGLLLSGIGFLLALIVATVLLRRKAAAGESLAAGLSFQARIDAARP
ncbi:MAG TPA: hypothetical protein VF323_05980, partial [Candidatus Limnocylindrales bacterium]